jgi:hypothetical protein
MQLPAHSSRKRDSFIDPALRFDFLVRLAKDGFEPAKAQVVELALKELEGAADDRAFFHTTLRCLKVMDSGVADLSENIVHAAIQRADAFGFVGQALAALMIKEEHLPLAQKVLAGIRPLKVRAHAKASTDRFDVYFHEVYWSALAGDKTSVEEGIHEARTVLSDANVSSSTKMMCLRLLELGLVNHLETQVFDVFKSVYMQEKISRARGAKEGDIADALAAWMVTEGENQERAALDFLKKFYGSATPGDFQRLVFAYAKVLPLMKETKLKIPGGLSLAPLEDREGGLSTSTEGGGLSAANK